MNLEVILASPDASFHYGKDTSLKGRWRFHKYGRHIVKTVSEDRELSRDAILEWPASRIRKHGEPLFKSAAFRGDYSAELGRDISDELFQMYGEIIEDALFWNPKQAVQAGVEWNDERFNAHSRAIAKAASIFMMEAGANWSYDRFHYVESILRENEHRGDIHLLTCRDIDPIKAGTFWSGDIFPWYEQELVDRVSEDAAKVVEAGNSWPSHRFAKHSREFGQTLLGSPEESATAVITWDDENYQSLEHVILHTAIKEQHLLIGVGRDVSDQRFARISAKLFERVAQAPECIYEVGKVWHPNRLSSLASLPLHELPAETAYDCLHEWPVEILGPCAPGLVKALEDSAFLVNTGSYISDDRWDITRDHVVAAIQTEHHNEAFEAGLKWSHARSGPYITRFVRKFAEDEDLVQQALERWSPATLVAGRASLAKAVSRYPDLVKDIGRDGLSTDRFRIIRSVLVKHIKTNKYLVVSVGSKDGWLPGESQDVVEELATAIKDTSLHCWDAVQSWPPQNLSRCIDILEEGLEKDFHRCYQTGQGLSKMLPSKQNPARAFIGRRTGVERKDSQEQLYTICLRKALIHKRDHVINNWDLHGYDFIVDERASALLDACGLTSAKGKTDILAAEEKAKWFDFFLNVENKAEFTALSRGIFYEVCDALRYATQQSKVEMFYDGLNATLQRGTTDAWASTIVKHFQSQGIGGGNYRDIALFRGIEK